MSTIDPGGKYRPRSNRGHPWRAEERAWIAWFVVVGLLSLVVLAGLGWAVFELVVHASAWMDRH